MTKATIAGGACAAVLVFFALVVGYRSLEQDVDPAAATVPVAVPPAAVVVAPSSRAQQDVETAEASPGLVDEDTEALPFPVPPKSEPLAPPPAPPARRSRWNPLRRLREGDQQWRYYLRGVLTVIVLLLLAWGLVWAFGELSAALSELWDTFGRTSETSETATAWLRIG